MSTTLTQVKPKFLIEIRHIENFASICIKEGVKQLFTTRRKGKTEDTFRVQALIPRLNSIIQFSKTGYKNRNLLDELRFMLENKALNFLTKTF